jgi:hypothetical protein
MVIDFIRPPMNHKMIHYSSYYESFVFFLQQKSCPSLDPIANFSQLG